MTRCAPSVADRELLAAAATAGQPVSYFQLERWRTAGLVPRNERRGLGRGRGTVSVAPPEALAMLLVTAKQARQGRALPGGGPLERAIRGCPVPDKVVRTAAQRQLRRIARGLALGGTDEAAWQRRHNHARRTAGSGPGLGLDDLLLPDTHQEGGTLSPRRGWTDAVAVLAHAAAGDVDSVAGEDLVRAFSTASGQPEAVIDQAVADVRAQEMAGVDLAALLVPHMSLHRMLDDLALVDLVSFRQALTTIGTIQAGHALLTMQALHGYIRREVGSTKLDELLPERLRRLPDGLDELRMHPAWAWVSHLTPSPRSWLATTVLKAMAALRDLTILAVLEDYRDKLMAIIASSP